VEGAEGGVSVSSMIVSFGPPVDPDPSIPTRRSSPPTYFHESRELSNANPVSTASSKFRKQKGEAPRLAALTVLKEAVSSK